MTEESVLTMARLVEENTALTAERDKLREALLAVEWTGRDLNGNMACGQCACRRIKGHAPDCIVGLALKGGQVA